MNIKSFIQPLNLQKGGLLFMLTKTLTIERLDLNINSLEYESTWIEIKNKMSTKHYNYRHPHNNFTGFFQYLENCLSVVVCENIELCGDFNFDLLKIDSDHITQQFINLLCSYGFLPLILQPTRVTDNTAMDS